ncbi:thioesterase II family protein [Streptomyces sp. NPDC059862]|uniref:thioesterase II family protein n=1 Tax=Streptomyces sp. NPDC059862 TaxID=3346975 RepID=UPI00364A4993
MTAPDPVTPAARWINARYAVGQLRLRMLCLPHAGGSSAAFSGWRPYLPEGVELAPLELPGRGSRIDEPVPGALEPLVEALLDGIRGELTLPYVLFGHSFGAVVAYELTRRIEREDGLQAPVALLVSGSRAPHVPLGREPLTGSDDTRLVAWLRGSGGLPEQLLEFPDFLRDLLYAVRADLEIAERYLLDRPAPVRCPVVAFAGADDEVSTPAQVEPWGAYTSAPSRMRVVPGGHSYPQSHPEATLTAVVAELRRLGLLGAQRDRQG